MRRALFGLFGVFGLFTASAGALVGYVAVAEPPTHDVPEPELRASSDPAVIARGAYLTHAVAHCSHCHGEDLAGGDVLATPFGEFWPPNLTPDAETGIGHRTDGEIARIVLHGVGADDRVAPFMKVALGPMAEEDVVAVLSYLRSLAPVHRQTPGQLPNLIGRALAAFDVFQPGRPPAPPYVPEGEPSVARGRYLAEGPAGCLGCHTDTDLMDDMAPLAPPFSGGRPHPSGKDPSMVYVPPNLTPDPETGVLARFTEDTLVARFRQGDLMPDSLMPWASYGRMSDDDLRSLYRYLSSLEPVSNPTGPVYRPG